MKAREFRELVEQLGLSQIEAARLFGVETRSVRRWESGERAVPGPVANFLVYLVTSGITGEDALAVIDDAGNFLRHVAALRDRDNS